MESMRHGLLYFMTAFPKLQCLDISIVKPSNYIGSIQAMDRSDLITVERELPL
jgi:hypothetical protein